MKRGTLDGVEIYDDVLDATTTKPVLKAAEMLCCSNGCGETEAVAYLVPCSETYEKEDPRTVVEVTLQRVWASKCCKAGLSIYNERTQDFRDCE